MVESIDVGDAEVLHRLLLDETNPLLPLVDGVGTSAGSIEDAAHLPFGEERVEHGFVELPLAVGAILAHDVEIELEHLSDFLVERHLT